MLILRITLLLLLFPTISQAQQNTELRVFLEGLNSGEVPIVARRQLKSPKYLTEYYISRQHRPIWTGKGSLAKALPDLEKAIRDSAKHGLNPEYYHLSILSETESISNNSLELLATDAFLTQVIHRSSGVVSVLELDPDWHLMPVERDPVAVLDQLEEAGDGVASTLEKLWPKHPEYNALLAERARIASLGKVMTELVPEGQVMKIGQSSERVALLKARLLGPGEHSNLYDDSLRLAVQSFQTEAGIEPDGIVGQATLEVLNATPVNWIDRIDANLERWRWLPHEQPPVMIRVNIAAFHLRAIQNGSNVFTMKVVVGKPYRNTPVFTEMLKYMVINPFWNVPNRLAIIDKLPLLQADPMKLAQQGFEVKMPGSDKFIPVSEMNWSKVSRRDFNYQLRQRPGPDNALGKVKFMLPNRFSVYLHDTNDKNLFTKQERSFSSGCIRLSEPVKLAQWLLSNEKRINEAANIETLIENGKTTTIYFEKPVPVYIVYLTAFTDDAGNIIFRRDLYKRDKLIVDGLRKPY